MVFPVKDFKTLWNLTAGLGFGAKTSYGLHEANDINLNTGSNTDLGQPIFAVADGEITSVHTHTGSPTFGKHIHLKFNIDGKDYWGHYAHLQDVFVVEGQKVKQGDKIGTVGNSGTTFAHLHFAIKNQPTGIDGLAKTSEDLKKWENPIPFIERNFEEEQMVTISQKELDEIRLARDTHYNDLQSEKDSHAKTKSDLQKEQDRVGELLRQLEKYSDEDKDTLNKLLEAEKALQPYQEAVSQIKALLGAENDVSLDDTVGLVKALKEQKTKYKGVPSKGLFLAINGTVLIGGDK